LCGFYAAVAAILVCNGVDPTGAFYNTAVLVDTVETILQTGVMQMMPVAYQQRPKDTRVEQKPKLYCLCHQPKAGRDMITCSRRQNHSYKLPPPLALKLGYSLKERARNLLSSAKLRMQSSYCYLQRARMKRQSLGQSGSQTRKCHLSALIFVCTDNIVH